MHLNPIHQFSPGDRAADVGLQPENTTQRHPRLTAKFTVPANERLGAQVHASYDPGPARQLEALLIEQLFAIMMPDNPDEFSQGIGASTWHSMFVQTIAGEVAGAMDLGLADALQQQLAGDQFGGLP